MMEEQIIQQEQTESIELELTAKGLYKWTIKVRDKMLSIDTIERIDILEKKLKTTYPNNVMSN
jgi:hypothetical protein